MRKFWALFAILTLTFTAGAETGPPPVKFSPPVATHLYYRVGSPTNKAVTALGATAFQVSFSQPLPEGLTVVRVGRAMVIKGVPLHASGPIGITMHAVDANGISHVGHYILAPQPKNGVAAARHLVQKKAK